MSAVQPCGRFSAHRRPAASPNSPPPVASGCQTQVNFVSMLLANETIGNIKGSLLTLDTVSEIVATLGGMLASEVGPEAGRRRVSPAASTVSKRQEPADTLAFLKRKVATFDFQREKIRL